MSGNILEEDAVSEDIGIIGDENELVAVIIPKYLYEFLQEKIEEAEDVLDCEAVEAFRKAEEK